MVEDRVLEIIAGVAAAIFFAAMIWTDFSADASQRREQLRPVQYATALIVLACVIALGVRG